MTEADVLAMFRRSGALLEGHFTLSSGLHSPGYLQCARVLMDPRRAERLAQALANKIPAEVRDQIEAVVSPAMGGVIIGHEMGRALAKPAMFVERPDGEFGLRRGFSLVPGTKVLMVEDVVTTGSSALKAVDAVAATGATVVGAATLVDRGEAAAVAFAARGVPYVPLLTYRDLGIPPVGGGAAG